MSESDILVVGHHGVGQIIRVHAFPKPGESIVSLGQLNMKDSGKGVNQAICLGLLGCSVAFVGKVGDDELGHLGAEWMHESGVDTSGIIFSSEMTTSRGLIFIDDQGQNTIINSYKPEGYLRFEELEQAIRVRARAKYFLTGFEIPVKVALQCTKLAKELGMFTVVNPGPASREDLGDLSYIDVLIPNETEAMSLAGINESAQLSNLDVIRCLKHKCNTKSVVMTLGSEGLLGLDDEGDWNYPGVQIKVVDTLGAGDAFIGGLLWGLTENNTVREASWYANFVAALSVTKQGSFPSYHTKEEVLEFIHKLSI
jgi:ribokinase